MRLELPGYEIVREIGRGAMSTVYLAVRQTLDRPVALKVLSPNLTADPNFRERFLKEGRIIAKLSHTHIVTVHDIGQYRDLLYMDLEYAGGGSLATRIAAGISNETGVALIIQVASALSYAHQRDFVHRDIKPDNILFREDGTALLSDFGIAKALEGDADLTGVGFAIGTPSYMSPEQASGKSVTTQSDIYGIGATFYEVLTGSKPYIGKDSISVAIKHINEPIPRLPSDLAHYQPILDLCMAKSPLERYTTCDELVRDLQMTYANSTDTVVTASESLDTIVMPSPLTMGESSQGNRILEQPTETAAETASQPRSRGPWIGFLLLLFLGLAGIVGYWQFRMEKEISPAANLANLNIDIELPDSRIEEQARSLLKIAEGFHRLEQDYPLDKEVLPLINEVGKELAKLIAFANSSGNDQLGHSLMNEATTVVPGSKALSDLRRKLDVSRGDHELSPTEHESVSRLLSDAVSHARANRYTLPNGSSALDSYRRVLVIDPGNKTAIARLNEIADTFLKRAEEDIARLAYRDAGGSIEAGLLFDPTHAGLRKLRERFHSPSQP